jgi:galactan 5-O-arabinofuranosyltransferase
VPANVTIVTMDAGPAVEAAHARAPAARADGRGAAWSGRWRRALASARQSMRTAAPPSVRRTAVLVLVEAVIAVGLALGFLAWSLTIDVNPMNRRGQVSGLAQLQFRLAVCVLVLVVGLVVAQRLLRGRHRHVLVAIGCAAVAGLATGLVAGGMAVALRGTRYGLWAGDGDYAWILYWVNKMATHQPVPDYYPPLYLDLLRLLSSWTGQPPIYVVKPVQLVGTALFGPAAYLCWRLVLRPGWGAGHRAGRGVPVHRAGQAVHPGGPRDAHPDPDRAAAPGPAGRRGEPGRCGLGRGALRGRAGRAVPALLRMVRVGSARRAGRVRRTGAVAAGRRTGRAARRLRGRGVPRPDLAVRAGTGGPVGRIADNYFYFDTNTDPAYFGMWRNDRPGAIVESLWPPPAEWAGVGLFTIALAVGLGGALWLGWRRTPVVVSGCSRRARGSCACIWPGSPTRAAWCACIRVPRWCCSTPR